MKNNRPYMKPFWGLLIVTTIAISQSNALAQASKATVYQTLKARADQYFESGKYELAKASYDSCKTVSGYEFDDYLLAQIDASERGLSYRRSIKEICADASLWKACVGLHEKLLDINPKDTTAKRAVVSTYLNTGDFEFNRWDFQKAQTFYTKALQYNDPEFSLKAMLYLDSCTFYKTRLETGFSAVEVDSAAVFSTGITGINKIIQQNMAYPEVAAEKKIGGKVWVSFVINEKGRVIPELVKVIRSVGSGCDEEAIRIVRMISPWKPAYKNNRPVRFQTTLPIQFTIK
jgi:TonB family protein